jgi:hypothetical protein
MFRNMSPGTSMRATIPQNRARKSAPSMTIPHIVGRYAVVAVVYGILAAADVLDRKNHTRGIWRSLGEHMETAWR